MTYPKQPETFEELVKVARRVIDRQTGSMAEDAIILARWVLLVEESVYDDPNERNERRPWRR